MVVANDQDAAHRIIHVVRRESDAPAHRARFLEEVTRFRQAGADVVVPEETETSVQIFAHVLRAYRIEAVEIERQVRTIRAYDYQLLRGSTEEGHLLPRGFDEDGVHPRRY